MIKLVENISFCAISLEINHWNVHCFTPVLQGSFCVCAMRDKVAMQSHLSLTGTITKSTLHLGWWISQNIQAKLDTGLVGEALTYWSLGDLSAISYCFIGASNGTKPLKWHEPMLTCSQWGPLAFKTTASFPSGQWVKPICNQCTVECCHNAVNFPPNPHERHPITCLVQTHDFYSASAIAVMYAISCYIGLHYNGTRYWNISFICINPSIPCN